MSTKPRTNLFYYVIVLIAAAAIALYVFMRNYRAGEEAATNAPPQAEQTTGGQKTVDERALAKDMSLATKGKQLFQINCASCHGPEGLGNGPRAQGMTPPPRNYHTEKFKFGNDIVSIHNTIMKGSPGTSMPSFALLPLEDTWALAHFVYTQIPNPPPIADAQLAQLPGGAGQSSGAAPSGQATAQSTGTAQPSTPATAAADTTKQKTAASQPKTAPANTDTTRQKGAPKPTTTPPAPDTTRIPIELAMQRLTVGVQAMPARQAAIASSASGALIYAQHCASCHGARGEGKAERVLAVAPYRYEVTGDLTISSAPWTHDRNKFSAIVVQGLPGRMMPGEATLTSSQVDDLYVFVRSLSTAP